MTPTVLTTPARATPGSVSGFANDVRHYLTQHPRQLPSRYLYDDLGSALFEAICRLPWYPLTRAELRLLEAHAREVLDAGITTVIELGSGSGDKLSALIAAAGSRRGRLELHLVDVSSSALTEAGQALERLENVRVVTHQATYEIGLEEFGLARSARTSATSIHRDATRFWHPFGRPSTAATLSCLASTSASPCGTCFWPTTIRSASQRRSIATC